MTTACPAGWDDARILEEQVNKLHQIRGLANLIVNACTGDKDNEARTFSMISDILCGAAEEIDNVIANMRKQSRGEG